MTAEALPDGADRTAPAWLDDREQAAWRGLIGVAMLLPGAVDAHLKPLAGLTNFDYYILAMLSEAPDRSLVLGQLAGEVNSSLSRLSHAVSRLEARGLVCRRPGGSDARRTSAVLTDDGWALLRQLAPAHVAEVRRLVFDVLDDGQVAALADITATLGLHLRRR